MYTFGSFFRSSCATSACYCKLSTTELVSINQTRIQQENESTSVIILSVPPYIQVYEPFYPYRMIASTELDITVIQVEAFCDSNKLALLTFQKKLRSMYIVNATLVICPNEESKGEFQIQLYRMYDLLEEAKFYSEVLILFGSPIFTNKEPQLIINYGTYLLIDYQHQFLIYTQRVMKSFLKSPESRSFAPIPFSVASTYLNKPEMMIEQEDTKFKIRKHDTSKYDFILTQVVAPGSSPKGILLQANIAQIVGITKEQELIPIKKVALEMGVEQIYLVHTERSYYMYKSEVLEQITLIHLLYQTRLTVIDFSPKIRKVFLSHGEEPLAVIISDNEPNKNVVMKFNDEKRPSLSFFPYNNEIHFMILLSLENYLVGSLGDDSKFISSQGEVKLRNLGQVLDLQGFRLEKSKQRQVGIVSGKRISLFRKGINIEKVIHQMQIPLNRQRPKSLFLINQQLLLLSFNELSILMRDGFKKCISANYCENEATIYAKSISRNWIIQITRKGCYFFNDPNLSLEPIMLSKNENHIQFDQPVVSAYGGNRYIYTISVRQTVCYYEIKADSNSKPYLEMNGKLDMNESISSLAVNESNLHLFFTFWLQPTRVVVRSPTLQFVKQLELQSNKIPGENIINSTFHGHDKLILGLSSGHIRILSFDQQINLIDQKQIHLSSHFPITLVPYFPDGTLCIGNQVFLVKKDLETSIVNWDHLEDAASAEGLLLGRLNNGVLQLVKLFHHEDKLCQAVAYTEDRKYLYARFFGHLLVASDKSRVDLFDLDVKILKHSLPLFNIRVFGLEVFQEPFQLFLTFGERLNDTRKRGFMMLAKIENQKLVELTSINVKQLVTHCLVKPGTVCFIQETKLSIFNLTSENDSWQWTKQYHYDFQLPLRGADWQDHYLLVRDAIKGITLCRLENKQLAIFASQQSQCSEARFLGHLEHDLPNVILFESSGYIKIMKINTYSLGILDQLKLVHLERLAIRFPVYSVYKTEGALVFGSICGEVGFLFFSAEHDMQMESKDLVRLEKPTPIRKGGVKVMYFEQLKNQTFIRQIENQMF